MQMMQPVQNHNALKINAKDIVIKIEIYYEQIKKFA